MNRKRTNMSRSVVVFATLASILAGCGKVAEKAAERAVEEAIESESGEDVDIDFSGDEFTIESEDGEVTMQVDEDGNVQIDGVGANGEEGSLEINEDGSFTATDENGEVATGDFDVDGETFEYEDGETQFASTEGIPEQWPDDVPRPEGLDGVTGSFLIMEAEQTISVSGQSSLGAKEYVTEYATKLVDAGFVEEALTTTPESSVGTYVRGDTRLSIGADAAAGGASTVTIILF